MSKTKNVLSISGKPKDFPFAEICKRAEELAKEGHQVYQKWTCLGCKQRIGSETPNYFTKFGFCEDCGHTTNIEEKGCNYLIVMKDLTLEQAANILEGKPKNG